MHAVAEEEAEIGTGNKRDFASLLDDLFVASEKGEEEGARPSIPFDYLSVADELHSGRIKVAGESVAAEYREAGADLAAEFAALELAELVGVLDQEGELGDKLFAYVLVAGGGFGVVTDHEPFGVGDPYLLDPHVLGDLAVAALP